MEGLILVCSSNYFPCNRIYAIGITFAIFKASGNAPELNNLLLLPECGVATAALTTKFATKFIYNNGNNASTDNITAGVAA